jgi:hypothetical protein
MVDHHFTWYQLELYFDSGDKSVRKSWSADSDRFISGVSTNLSESNGDCSPRKPNNLPVNSLLKAIPNTPVIKITTPKELKRIFLGLSLNTTTPMNKFNTMKRKFSYIYL